MVIKGRFYADKSDVTNGIMIEGGKFYTDIREGFHITDTQSTQTRGQTMKFPPFPYYSMGLFVNRLRKFTFIPRRFSTHYWDDRHCLISITWWQWFCRCFCVHSHIVNRPEFSSWKQIRNRMNNGDLDAKLIYKCIEIMQSRKYDYCEPADEIYRKLIDHCPSRGQ